MKITAQSLFLACTLFCGTGWAAVIIVEDNFNDNIINESIWRNLDDDPIGENYPYRYPVERNGRLEIYNNQTDDSSGLRTQINLPVDDYFEARVSFNASECSQESFVCFSVHNFTTDYDHAVQYAMIANGASDGHKWFVISSTGIGDEQPVYLVAEPTSTIAGTFYITYSAGTVYLSSTGHGAANALSAVDISGWTDCAQVWLALTAWSKGDVLSGSGSYFDDFYLQANDQSGALPVYRFWSEPLGHHFYTINEAERDKLIDQYAATWTYEGTAYQAFAAAGEPGTSAVHRFWSDRYKGHFYTISESEKNKLVNNYSHVWTYEGPGFYAYPEGEQPAGTSPVYRFWSEVLGGHFYTISETEKDKLVHQYGDVWAYEGIAWYAYE